MKTELFRIIILSGKKQSGKSSASFRLANDHSFAQIAYADQLKEFSVQLLHQMDCVVSYEHFEKEELKNEFIYDIEGKKFLFTTKNRNSVPMTYRQFIQRVGTEAIRDNIHDGVWIIPVKKFIREAFTNPSQRYRGVVISDARFLNEIEDIKKYCKVFGDRAEVTTVEIIRPNVKHTDQHSSETSLKNYKFDIGLLIEGDILFI